MATSRYTSRNIIKNNDELYKQKLFDKGTTSFQQYDTAKLTFPSDEELSRLQILTHIWKQGDSFEKLANVHYKDSNYWWVIAFINQKPTEQHFSVGDTVFIPLPLYELLSLIGY
jgi:nucleoid-associated protein YgaU